MVDGERSAMQATVFVALDEEPRFPKNCVVCREPWPDGSVVVSHRHETAVNAFGLIPLGQLHSFEVPACSKCAVLLRQRYRLDMLLVLLAGILAAACGFVANRFGFSQRLSFILAVVVLSVGLMLRRTFTPPPFDFTANGTTSNLSSRTRSNAEVFRSQNQILGINGVA